MGSHHHHHTDTDHHEQSQNNIKVAFWLNTAFAVFEIAGGIYTNSLAVLSDAVHDLGDSLSLGLSYYFQKKSTGKRDSRYSYGYRRFSLVGAFVNSVILISGSVIMIAQAVTRMTDPPQPDAKGMILLAIVGIAVNALALLKLRKGHSINEKVVSLHFLEDVLGWLAVLAGAVVMTFAEVPILDPILSILIACYILFNVYRNLRSVIRIFLQGIPSDVSEEEVLKQLNDIKEIRNIHDLHIWTMDGRYHILTMHVVVNKEMTISEVEKIRREIKLRLIHLTIQHATIEIETSAAHCGQEDC